MSNEAKKSSDTVAVAGMGAYLIGAAITAGVFIKWGMASACTVIIAWPLMWVGYFAWWLA